MSGGDDLAAGVAVGEGVNTGGTGFGEWAAGAALVGTGVGCADLPEAAGSALAGGVVMPAGGALRTTLPPVAWIEASAMVGACVG